MAWAEPVDLEQRNKDIVRLFHAGMTYPQLGAMFNLSNAGIHKVIHKTGVIISQEERARRRRLPRKPAITWTPEMNRALIVTRVNGGNVQKCADTVGVGYTLAMKKLKEFGLAKGLAA